MGGTALFDAIGNALTSFDDKQYGKGLAAHLITVLTDGEENQSQIYKNTIGSLVRQYNQTGTTTLVIQCPASIKQQLVSIGIPQDNITTWTGTAETLQQTSIQKTSGITNYYNARNLGMTSSANFYQPDLSFSPTKLKRELVDVTHNFLISGVTKMWDGKQIRDFVEREVQRPYKAGCAFYQLTKVEKVQANKEIVVRDLNTGRMYGGDDARELLQLPEGVEIKLEPVYWNNKYEIYIKSNSVNRKLVGGTKLLVRA
jgi:hypothetical protein